MGSHTNVAGWEVSAGVGTAGLLATIAAWGYGKWLRKQFTSKLEEWAFLDTLYADTFRHELALQDRGDLQAMWSGMRSTTRENLHDPASTEHSQLIFPEAIHSSYGIPPGARNPQTQKTNLPASSDGRSGLSFWARSTHRHGETDFQVISLV